MRGWECPFKLEVSKKRSWISKTLFWVLSQSPVAALKATCLAVMIWRSRFFWAGGQEGGGQAHAASWIASGASLSSHPQTFELPQLQTLASAPWLLRESENFLLSSLWLNQHYVTSLWPTVQQAYLLSYFLMTKPQGSTWILHLTVDFFSWPESLQDWTLGWIPPAGLCTLCSALPDYLPLCCWAIWALCFDWSYEPVVSRQIWLAGCWGQ